MHCPYCNGQLISCDTIPFDDLILSGVLCTSCGEPFYDTDSVITVLSTTAARNKNDG